MDGWMRYGVFLRPDPRTCAAVATVTALLRAQYGLVSAAAFPPHATLAGSLPLATSPDGLVNALGHVLDRFPAFPVHNAGVRTLDEGAVGYDLHDLDGNPNAALINLAGAVGDVVRPLLAPAPAGQLPADTYQPGRWRGHLSLTSHDLLRRADLHAEVEEFVVGLAVPFPSRFPAEIVALYRFAHATWTGPWWQAMSWEHLRSWRLPAA